MPGANWCLIRIVKLSEKLNAPFVCLFVARVPRFACCCIVWGRTSATMVSKVKSYSCTYILVHHGVKNDDSDDERYSHTDVVAKTGPANWVLKKSVNFLLDAFSCLQMFHLCDVGELSSKIKIVSWELLIR